MRTKLALALLTTALLGGVAPVAGAAVVRATCGYESLSGSSTTGDGTTYRGAAYGVAVFDDDGTHTLRCYVTVDGAERASTPLGSGAGAVVTAGPVTFEDDLQTVALCTEIDGVTTSCDESTTVCLGCPGPDTDLVDFLFDVLVQVIPSVDPVACPVLASLAPGVPGVADISPEGDTTLAVVGPFWDCPPYGNLFPPS